MFEIVKSSFPTFHHWWRENWIYWRDSSRPSHCYGNFHNSYNTTYSRDSLHHLSRWFIYKSTSLQLLVRSLNWKNSGHYDTLCQLGPKFGYYPEGGKFWLIKKISSIKQIFFVEEVSKLQQTVKDVYQQLPDLLNTKAHASKKRLVSGLRIYKCYVKLHGLTFNLLIHALWQDLWLFLTSPVTLNN